MLGFDVVCCVCVLLVFLFCDAEGVLCGGARHNLGTMAYIVLIEDSAEVSHLVAGELRDLAFEVATASDGVAGLALLEQRRPDLLILDVMLPGLNGLELLRRLRHSGFDKPILLLTARDAEADRVAGLELGADDYIVKPFSLRELSARVAALLRRYTRGHAPVAPSAPTVASANGRRMLRFLDCELDPDAALVWVGGKSCTLSLRELTLLTLLMRSPGRVLTREWLLEQVWGRDYSVEDRAVDACVLRLRERLGRESGVARALETVRGLGYRLRTGQA
jgi:DNA-binding response OmpR family regulator